MFCKIDPLEKKQKINTKSLKNQCEFRAGKKTRQNHFKISFGSVLDSLWDGFGTVLDLFWALLAAFGTFKTKLFFNIGLTWWAPRSLLDRFWVDLGKDLGGFCEELGRFSEGLGRILHGTDFALEQTVGRFWKCLAWFGPAGAQSRNRTPSLICEASQFS